MVPDPQDTIVALASARGPGARAIVRIGGPAAWTVVSAVFTPAWPSVPRQRWFRQGQVSLPGIASRLPADLYFWPAPRTYTGQDLAELHTISCCPLVDLLVAQILKAGARAAQPGEFTLRSFLAGKLDLPRAEAVLGIIEASNRDELRAGLAQLAGGLTHPLKGLREDLLDLLAEVEAGLDFAEEDIHFVEQKALLDRLAKGLALVTLVHKQLVQRSRADRPFRVALVGLTNAGKSSLFNALAGSPDALVSPEPGTTRDYLVRRLNLNGVALDLMDTAGNRGVADRIEKQAQALGRDQAEQADLVVLCLPPNGLGESSPVEDWSRTLPVVEVATKCDLGRLHENILGTSALTGEGVEALRSLLAKRAADHGRPPLAPSWSRCCHHVEVCLERLRQAHAAVLFEDPPEILALELRAALDELGEMVGAVYTDDLLDRIFSRFCIGK